MKIRRVCREKESRQSDRVRWYFDSYTLDSALKYEGRNSGIASGPGLRLPQLVV
jgi:hypothetical protein